MRNKVTYEYAIEVLKDRDDCEIIDTHYFDKYMDMLYQAREDVMDCKFVDLCVIRYEGNDLDGEYERGYAYIFDNHGWQRPEVFDCNNPIPKFILKEIDSILKLVQ